MAYYLAHGASMATKLKLRKKLETPEMPEMPETPGRDSGTGTKIATTAMSVVAPTIIESHQIGIKVFAATKAKEREFLGETITDWIRTHPEYEVFDKIVTQSSDDAYHCLTIVLIFRYVAK